MDNTLRPVEEWGLLDMYNLVISDFFNILPVDSDEGYDKIYIDLDSALSIMLSQPLPSSKDDRTLLIKNTITKIAEFLENWKNESEIKIYWSFKPTKLFNKYIPEWNNKRNQRLKEEKTIKVIQTEIISRLNKVGKALENVKIIECDDSPIISIAKDIRLATNNGKYTLVMSRDPHYNCLFNSIGDLTIYNGRKIFNKNNLRKIQGELDISPILLPYAYTLMGMGRNEYKGLNKWGPVKVTSYINKNGVRIVKGEDELIRELEAALQVFLLSDILEKK